ncbi:MAG: 5-bromo-4-chloroindolyl phosphate hydrolysis family protein [Desulfovibrio sp.]|nr:5-bromo-4-chloroindolyl phosphate hydrolysis family protein [Desulfovibrio sp.]
MSHSFGSKRCTKKGPSSNNGQNPAPVTDQEPSGLAIFGRRVLIHALGLFIGDVLSNAQNGSPTVMVLAWIGFICLIPRGNWKKAEWFIPVGSGLIQMLTAYLGGCSPAESIFFGGLQTWLQRIVQKDVRRVWDWIVLPAMLGCLNDLHLEGAPMGLFITFAAIFAASFAARAVYRRVRAEQLHEEALKAGVERLSAILPSFTQEELVTQVKMLKIHGDNAVLLLENKIRDAYPIIDRFKEAVDRLVSFQDSSRASKASGWSKGLLRSENWGRKGDKTLGELSSFLQETNTFLQTELKKFRQGKNVNASEEEKKWLAYEDSANELLSKSSVLPQTLSKPVQSIAQSTLSIVKSMRDDPADRLPGERFLDRYLVAVHKIVDEHMRLAGGPMQKDIENALQRSVEVLERMDSVFKDELASLMQNDAINFSAEVEALDAMLSMKGR